MPAVEAPSAPAVSRARTLAIFGTVRIREFVVPRGHSKPVFRDPPGLVGLHHVRSGAIDLETPDGARRFAAGEAFVISHDSVPVYSPRGDLQLISIVVPAQVLEGIGVPGAGEIRAVPSDSALLDPALGFAGRAANVDTNALSGFSSYYFERLLQEMVIGVMVEGAQATPPPHEPGLYSNALAVIAAQRSDPALAPRTVAQQIKISLRQLQRVFSAQATTAEREIRRARVEHAVELLTDRAYDAMSVEDVGRYSGFAGGSSLARAMAAEGRESPARVRRASRTLVGALRS